MKNSYPIRSRVSHAPPQGGGTNVPNFWGFPAYTLRRITTKFDVVTHMERAAGLVCWSQPHPNPKGAGPKRSPISGFSIFDYTLFNAGCRRSTRKYVGEGMYLVVCHTSVPSFESGVSVLPNFGVLLYSCVHTLMQNEQIRCGNRWGGVRFITSATTLHLHKCVARFVSE